MKVSLRGSRSRPAAASHSTLPTMLRLLCLLAGLAATVTGACEAPFIALGEGCYYFSIEDGIFMPWTEARQYCLSLGSEGDLAMLDSVCDDFRNLGTYYRLQASVSDFFVVTWLGATGSGDNWFWVDGRSFSTGSSYWYPGRPFMDMEDVEGAVCASMSRFVDGGHERIHLQEYYCLSALPFICQDFGADLQQ